MSLKDKVQGNLRQLQLPPPEATRQYSLAELYRAEMPPLTGALAGHVFTPQAVSLIIGDFGVGKTWLALSLSTAIAAGRSWGHMATAQRNVLFLSEEMVAAEMQPRLRKLLSPKQVDELDPVLVPRFRVGFKLEQEAECARMVALILETHAQFVIIDALRDVHRVEEDSNDAMSVVFRNIRDLVATPTGAHVCLLHHTSKPNEFRKGAHRGRGAVVMMDVSADVLVVDKGKDGVNVVSFDKTRHGESPRTFGYRISNDPEDKTKVLFEIIPDQVSPTDVMMEARQIRTFIEKKGSLTRPQIMAAMSIGQRKAEEYIAIGVKERLFVNIAKVGLPGIYDIPERRERDLPLKGPNEGGQDA